MTGKVVLIVASHPDDEVLGVGGTTCAHAAAGDTVEILIVAEGVTSRYLEETPKIVNNILEWSNTILKDYGFIPSN